MVRVRFAPSPTGDPHVGSAWTALFNWLFAKHNNGTFILRIEDTDRERLVPRTVDRIYELLDWLGLKPDEGPREGGPHAPYVQSERLSLYREAADRLLANGSAYQCFCTTERLAELRAQQQGRGEAPMYDRRCRSIPAEESLLRAKNEPHVVRFAIPDGTIEAQDAIRGAVRWGNATLDDTVLLKSDGYPTYHLANVVDDHAMEITHVIRAEEWLPSLPKHLLLYRAFEWTPPVFAHLPLILGSDRKKLSKRHGHTAALEYRDDYLPEAFMNFLALLGWRPPKSDQEIFTREELISLFDLKDVRKSGAIFDVKKLNYVQQIWKFREMENFANAVRNHYRTHINDSVNISKEIIALSAQRWSTISEVAKEVTSILNPPELEAMKLVPKEGHRDMTRKSLRKLYSRIKGDDGELTRDKVEEIVLSVANEQGVKPSLVQWPFRIALSHTNPSPPGAELAFAHGREITLQRLQEAINAL